MPRIGPRYPISPQQRVILEGLSAGLTDKEMAQRFGLSLNTVKAHTRMLYLKLSAKTRAQAVDHAYKCGVLDPIRPE